MMSVQRIYALIFAMVLAGLAFGQPKMPPRSNGLPPETLAKMKQTGELRQKAIRHLDRGELDAAIPILKEAIAINRTYLSFESGGYEEYLLGKIYEKQNKLNEAVVCFRTTFKWAIKRQEVLSIGNSTTTVEYALFLSRTGDDEGAKEMYKCALRRMQDTQRYHERVPFLFVFDPDPEGDTWEYTPQRLEAAAMMIYAINKEGLFDPVERKETLNQEALIERARQLEPAWIYPILYKASLHYDSPEFPGWMATAEALARTPVQKQVLEFFKRELAEYKAWIAANPNGNVLELKMEEGVRRRKLLQCIKPNPEVLKRICRNVDY